MEVSGEIKHNLGVAADDFLTNGNATTWGINRIFFRVIFSDIMWKCYMELI
jgi:hypothetical protein